MPSPPRTTPAAISPLTKDSYPRDLLAPLTQNPTQYCENNPVYNIDPQGHEAIAAAVGWGLVASGGTIGVAVAIGLAVVGAVLVGSLVRNAVRNWSQPKIGGLLSQLKEHLGKHLADCANNNPMNPKHEHGGEVGKWAAAIVAKLAATKLGECWNAFDAAGETRESLQVLSKEPTAFLLRVADNPRAADTVAKVEALQAVLIGILGGSWGK